VGIVETQSVASAILSLDSALKTASTDLVDMKLGKGLGGKGYFVLTGELSEVEAALNAAKLTLEDGDKFLRSDIIARPHEDFSVSVSL
jgi:microcompartment protein CcmL/EutN